MKTTYFKIICQKTTDNHTIMVAVIPNDMLGKNLPDIFEANCTMNVGDHGMFTIIGNIHQHGDLLK